MNFLTGILAFILMLFVIVIIHEDPLQAARKA